MSRRYGMMVLLWWGASSMACALEYSLNDVAQDNVNTFLEIVLQTQEKSGDLVEFKCTPPVYVEDTPVLKIDNREWMGLVNGKTGHPYSFARKTMLHEEEEQSKDLTHEDAISKDTAFGVFLPVAQRFSLPIAQQQYSIRFVDFAEHNGTAQDGSEQDLCGCLWIVSYDYTHEGTPCRERGLRVSISALSGKIQSVWHSPPVLPEDEELEVTREQAKMVVANWLASKPYFADNGRATRFDENVLEHIQLVIASPNPFPDGHLSRVERAAASSSRYCWEVRFESMEMGDWFPYVAWVDGHSGAVIGGAPSPGEG